MYHEIQFLISFENVFLGPFSYLLHKAKRTKYDLNYFFTWALRIYPRWTSSCFLFEHFHEKINIALIRQQIFKYVK